MIRLTAFALCALLPLPALASICHAFVNGPAGQQIASLDFVAAPAPEVAIDYIGHSTYRIETPGGVSILTDYFGMEGPKGPPTVATMNKAHSTHYTNYPDPAIQHIFRGWNPEGGKAIHLESIGDVTIRNVTTDIRAWTGTAEKDGNSIFVFEVADLCIGHLGHLHHMPTEMQFAEIGRLDVVMVPVDGSWTMPIADMVDLMKRLRARIVLPMHYFGRATLERFLAGMHEDFRLEVLDEGPLAVSIDRMPAQPTVVVLPPVRLSSLD